MRRRNQHAIGWTLAVQAAGAGILVVLVLIGLREGSAGVTGEASAVAPEAGATAPDRAGERTQASPAQRAGDGPLDRASPAADRARPAPVGLAAPTAGSGADRGQPRGEREHYEAFLALAAAEPGALEELAPAVLEGGDPAYRKVALLRALHDLDSPARASAFAFAIGLPETGSDPRGIPLSTFAVRFLGRHAAHDPVSRGVLARAAFGPERAGSASLRHSAAAHLARTADASELAQLAWALSAGNHEDEGDLLRAVAGGLVMNPEQRTVALLFDHLQLPDVHAPLEEADADHIAHEELR